MNEFHNSTSFLSFRKYKFVKHHDLKSREHNYLSSGFDALPDAEKADDPDEQ